MFKKVKMDIKSFLKLELSGWNKYEVRGLLCAFLIILINSLFLHDSIIAVISALCGILYTIIAGKGKISCYFFGILGTGCYSYLSYKNALYGNLLLYMCYYLPMEVIGIFAWRKNLNKTTNEIIKTKLNRVQIIRLSAITVSVCGVFIYILKSLNDSSPYIDGITTILSVLGMYLTVKRCIEQWIIWIIVNGLSVIMWINLVMHGAKTVSTIVMWSVYLILGIYFYIQWRKELARSGNA